MDLASKLTGDPPGTGIYLVAQDADLLLDALALTIGHPEMLEEAGGNCLSRTAEESVTGTDCTGDARPPYSEELLYT